jgi:hypothetical protein
VTDRSTPRPEPPACPEDDAYEPPQLTVLGTVQELTRGGTAGTLSDGFGTAGAAGMIS